MPWLGSSWETASQDPRCRKFLYLVKNWGKARNIGNASQVWCRTQWLEPGGSLPSVLGGVEGLSRVSFETVVAKRRAFGEFMMSHEPSSPPARDCFVPLFDEEHAELVRTLCRCHPLSHPDRSGAFAFEGELLMCVYQRCCKY